MLTNILLVFIAGLIAWFLVRIFTRTGASSGPPKPRFSAVSVYSPSDRCQAASALKGIHFLSNEAPHLPLDGCTAAKCHCVYRHHADRRSGNGDRRGIVSGNDFLLGRDIRNRRLGSGRREIDKDSDLSWN